MTKYKVLAEKQAQRRKLLDYLYANMTIGVEHANMSAQRLAGEVGLTPAQTTDRIREMTAVGILTRRYEMRRNVPGGGAQGRIWFWKLLPEKFAAQVLLDRLDEEEDTQTIVNRSTAMKAFRNKGNGSMKPGEVRLVVEDRPAITVRQGVEVEAIVGPEPKSIFEELRALRKDESYALVEAARQYQTRGNTIAGGVDALIAQAKSLGVDIDVEQLRGAITVQRDERLETVALVLPYIEQLETEVRRLTTRADQYKDKVSQFDQLRRDNETLRAQNQRLMQKAVAS